MNTKG